MYGLKSKDSNKTSIRSKGFKVHVKNGCIIAAYELGF